MADIRLTFICFKDDSNVKVCNFNFGSKKVQKYKSNVCMYKNESDDLIFA